jgi:hypothetical protein
MGKKKRKALKRDKQATVESGLEETSPESSSSSRSHVSYPQLPPIPDGSAGPSATPDSHKTENSEDVSSKGKAPVRDPEILPDAPPLLSSRETTPPAEQKGRRIDAGIFHQTMTGRRVGTTTEKRVYHPYPGRWIGRDGKSFSC